MPHKEFRIMAIKILNLRKRVENLSATFNKGIENIKEPMRDELICEIKNTPERINCRLVEAK